MGRKKTGVEVKRIGLRLSPEVYEQVAKVALANRWAVGKAAAILIEGAVKREEATIRSSLGLDQERVGANR